MVTWDRDHVRPWSQAAITEVVLGAGVGTLAARGSDPLAVITHFLLVLGLCLGPNPNITCVIAAGDQDHALP
ncbi:hypothetical protein NDU88_002194 [Pleurodeles waltl]|uniref:Uncharacterized protein n=1 Tax=Pleurodeles waltl TaxID=8319 RepID=A0AAV7NER2_PLEWA|nr:hypothetical protein NDU88_002194 [Pleurodeles waltl]